LKPEIRTGAYELGSLLLIAILLKGYMDSETPKDASRVIFERVKSVHTGLFTASWEKIANRER